MDPTDRPRPVPCRPARAVGPVIVTILGVLLGVVVVVAITAATGYFVAQEFGYMAVDRARLRARAADGDAAATRALDITRRTSFMLSGAQLGITVTGLLVGYVAEPLIGDGIGMLLGGVGVPTAVGVAVGTVFALLLSTVVQMIFGELFPKNLAIARPEPVARRLAGSTRVYLALFGWLIRIFDAASNALLGLLRIEPVHDVEHSATPRDLAAIIDDSRVSGDLRPDLARLLDRAVSFDERTARAAMVPRPRVAWAASEATAASLVPRMAAAHSRYPVLARPEGEGERELVGIVGLRDVLAAADDGRDLDRLTVSDLARDAVLVPTTLPLPEVLARLRGAGEQLACVLDEYGGLAGVVALEDLAEELVGEITDEHDRAGTDRVRTAPDGGGWLVPADHHVDEVGRLLAAELPTGDYETIGGLVTARLRRLPAVGDAVVVPLEAPDPDETPRELVVTVSATDRRVPSTVHVAWALGAGS
ncbi:hemolysin family protein [Actinomycetospora endophytica]|uniref:Hemolysin family protein n=1 Tax=Actinomycetospora endophytica TaxID=2291215 RepID=A0ABS8P2V0_9PSEU|nr:hemolysin family protein [Actinomycetospora endophytica]MCD2192409.1 hemolysin family protein [Actinomycetospora endophytica]